MPDPITWGVLAKAVGDNTTIDEEIDGLILNHNLDPSAHGQSNESVYNHRIAELLDHVSYSIYNVKVNPAARIYKAIVGPGFEADFQTLQAAIDWAHLYNGGIVHIKAGTYQQTDDVTLYSDIILEGEDDDLSIIDFTGEYHQVRVVGTSGSHKKNVTIKDLCIQGSWIDGEQLLFEYADDCIIQDCKFDNTDDVSSNQPVHLSINTGCNRIHIRRNRFLNGWHDLSIGNSKYLWIDSNYFYNNLRDCISGGGTQHVVIRDNMFLNYTTDVDYEGAIFFETTITELSIINNIFYHGSNSAIFLAGQAGSIISNNVIHSTTGSLNGISFENCHNCTITGNNIDLCDGSEIRINLSPRNVITGNTLTNGQRYGVEILSIRSSKNVVVGNVLTGNVLGAILDFGAGTIVANNAV
jgi:parallel beta-helix repeat protein